MLPPDSFRALADYLNVSIAELFAGRRFTGTDAPEDVSDAQADADSYLRFCAACRSPRIRLRRAAVALIDGFLEDVILFPEVQNFFFARQKVKIRRDLFKHVPVLPA